MADSAKKMRSPAQAAASRRNGRKRGPWTPDQRERVRQAAFRNRPWEHSTGPRTPEGKARVAANGRQRQAGGKSVRDLRGELGDVEALVRGMAGLRRELGGGRTR